ncbi:acetate--CoA ligase family protein [Pararhodobacter aggregans]|uniref:Acyl-CoA synthetase n=1 Tax=Pararhodobacter aggregans TaxID=404875 RepID=A0A2T7UQP4_9RHOB|nr:acetate--CoA ligase family protein [Pararhodobacter aggregans]PTX01794.1 acyl-CoA synthetase (NDP forming) [Pararhodobacter aggregans]PVE46997.1 acyl-CoA synthetase [Pararhodobacter aggregans]
MGSAPATLSPDPRLSRLLRPRSIAVLGAGWAQNVIEQCRRMGFDGPVWPIHPTRAEIAGMPCLRALAELPQAPDAVFIGVNRFATVEVVRELAAMGAGGAICFASGWEEAGEAGLQAQLVAAAGAMPILGPNCYGVINYLDGALLWPDQHGGRRVERGVALISQSSNIVINLTMQARGLPVAYVACLGNAAQVGLAELAGAVLADPRVTALGLYVEGIDDAPAFAALAEAARAAGKGMVVVKSGKTEASRAAAASHTAALAGGGAASSAFLRQAGVAEVDTLGALIEALKILHVHGPGIGARLCSLSCSGGEAGLVADLGATAGVVFEPPTDSQKARLGAVLGPLVTLANPLDYHTFIWGDGPKTEAVFTAMLEGYDAGIFVIDPPRPDRCDPASFEPAIRAIEVAQAVTGRPAFPVASLPENFDEDRAIAMIARGVVPLMGLETALEALVAAQRPAGLAGWRPWGVTPGGEAVLIDEARAKAMLAAAGIAVPKGVTAKGLAALDARGLTAPFALKGLGFAHKTEAGAVRLGVTDPCAEAEMPGARGYLCEEMVTGGLAELLLGIRRDPVYGATLTLGLGGVTAELLADTVTLVAPVTRAEIEAALKGLRLWPLLDGWRGRAKPAVGRAIDAALAMQSMMAADPALQEIEVNPLILTATEAVAVDAVIWRQR